MADLLKMMKSISELLMLGRCVITVDFDGEAWQMVSQGCCGMTSSLVASKNGALLSSIAHVAAPPI